MIRFMFSGFSLLFILLLSFPSLAKTQEDIRITIRCSNLPLEKALPMVEEKSGCHFIYSEDDLDKKNLVSISAQNELLTSVLNKMLSKAGLQYKMMENKSVIISRIEKKEAYISISGIIKDNKGSALSGVSVSVKNSAIGTVTDAQGLFDLRFQDNIAPVIVVSSIGYAQQELKVIDGQALKVTLEVLPGGLNEVVVTGYGKQKKGSVTASVATVKGDQLAKAPVANISNTLGGRVSGVISRQSSGAPGADNDQIRIRGIGTTGNSSPLVVVNGIPMDYNQLNPNEIETITILKDAAAVAPYGLAGANGVILVTTKRGTQGKYMFNYDGFYGIQESTNMPEFLDAYDYASALSLANQNIGNAATYTPEQLEKYKDQSDPDHFPNSDFVGRILQKGPITRHSISFTGGTEKLRIYGNLGYLYQEGIVPVINFRRYNFTINADANVTNTTVISVDINAALSKNTQPSGKSGASIFTDVTEVPPILPLTFSNGLYAHPLLPQIYESGYNNQNNNVFNGKIMVEQKLPFIKGLALKGALSFNKNYNLGKNWSRPLTFYSLNAQDEYITQPSGPPSPTLTEDILDSQRIVAQAYITFDRIFGRHSINALGVFEGQYGSMNAFSAGRINYAVNLDELSAGSSNKNDLTNDGYSGKNAQTGLVYQLNYAYASKYLIGLSGRYNGHYYFAPGERYAFFPAVAVAWNLSEEDFIKNNFDWLDNLKIRGSYGTSGNLAGNPFQYLTSYSLRSSYIFGGNAPNQVQGIYENAQANPFITCETAKKSNIGLDANLFKGKLGVVIDVFQERRSNMLITPDAVVPSEYGIGISQVNAGIMENKGIEVTLTTDHQFKNGLKAGAAFNLSYARNKLIQVFENGSTFNNPNRRITGRPWNTQFGLQDLGFYQLSDFEEDGTTLKSGIPVPSFGPVRPGDIKYSDIAGPPDASGKPGAPDGKIDVNDYTTIGDPLFPQITYGLNLNLSWKGFDANVLLQGALKANVYLSGETAYPFFNGAKIYKEQTDTWTPENTNASFPRLTPTPITNNTQTSSFWIRNGDFLRIKTLQVGYSIPESLIHRTGLRSIRIFAAGQNLFTFSDMKFLDPELGDSRARYYFQQKTYSFGLSLGF